MKLLYIENTEEAVFLKRPNRFTAQVKLISEEIITVHVHDTGRLSELLYNSNKVLIRKADNPDRKTKWDLIAAAKDKKWILINTAYHRIIGDRLLKSSISPIKNIHSIKPEAKYKDSRLDYFVRLETENKDSDDGYEDAKDKEKDLKRQIWIEVKGCNLLVDKTAMFPDAPTVRGVKHLNELIELKSKGFRAALLIFIFVDADFFTPNKERDPLFAETFQKAVKSGVEIYPLKFDFSGTSVTYKELICWKI